MPNVKKENRRKPISNFFCVVCGATISGERVIRKSVTCSNAHALLLKMERRRLRDMTRCRLCNRPCTPAERALFTTWRNMSPEDLSAYMTWRKDQKQARKQAKRELRAAEGHAPSPIEKELGTIQVN